MLQTLPGLDPSELTRRPRATINCSRQPRSG